MNQVHKKNHNFEMKIWLILNACYIGVEHILTRTTGGRIGLPQNFTTDT